MTWQGRLRRGSGRFFEEGRCFFCLGYHWPYVSLKTQPVFCQQLHFALCPSADSGEGHAFGLSVLSDQQISVRSYWSVLGFVERALWWFYLWAKSSLGIMWNPWDWDSKRTWVWIRLHLVPAVSFLNLSYYSCKVGIVPLHVAVTERMPLEHWTRCCVHKTCPGKVVLWSVGHCSHCKASYPICLWQISRPKFGNWDGKLVSKYIVTSKIIFSKQFMVFCVSQTTGFIVRHIYSFMRSVLFYAFKVFQEK